VFICEQHSSTVNDCVAWTAIDWQFGLHARSMLRPQPRSKQRHFLHTINTAWPGSCLANTFSTITSCWGQSSRIYRPFLENIFSKHLPTSVKTAKQMILISTLNAQQTYLFFNLFSLVNWPLRSNVTAVMSPNQQSVTGWRKDNVQRVIYMVGIGKNIQTQSFHQHCFNGPGHGQDPQILCQLVFSQPW